MITMLPLPCPWKLNYLSTAAVSNDVDFIDIHWDRGDSVLKGSFSALDQNPMEAAGQALIFTALGVTMEFLMRLLAV